MLFIKAIFIGCATGFVSAFFGIGGSSIDTPLLRTILHLPPYLALGTPLPTAFATVAIALLVYRREHLINYRVFGWSVLGGVPAIIFGSYVSQFFGGRFLMLLTAIVLFFVGIDFIFRIFWKKKKNGSEKKRENSSAGKILLVSFFTGIISGILAIGGGLFLIPGYNLILKMKIKEAIATSLLVVGTLIIPATLVHFELGHIDFRVSAALVCGVIPLAYVGAKADLRAKSSTIKFLFGALLIIFSIIFFFSQV
ncbi:MAG: sulfite exporter TauE/SafE family protein [Candidatus Moranbacteria bacterium]|nr:sulfite exporter TauE/SafE family protein [Candidatus Moranbacteria bacterium]